MLHQLVYMSAATDLFAPADLDDILTRSRRNNAAEGITGLLIFHDGNFLQVLEGETEKVLACYDRITGDPRHGGCLVIPSPAPATRYFGAWDMAYVPFTELAPGCQKNFINLKNLRQSGKMQELEQDRTTGIIVNTFLESFRDTRLL
ncbi:MAG: BLUF domain-containing protein [Proteobacteria bacterium]|nr:BLUF domain-containing protein [Pseudomonadota bacterium]